MGKYVDITVEGLADLEKKLANPEVVLGEPFRDYFGQMTAIVEGSVRLLTPAFSGKLLSRLYSQIDPKPIPHWAKVANRAPHAWLVEFGSKPHFPPPNNPRLIEWGKSHGFENTFVLARAISRKGTQGAFMFRRAMVLSAALLEGMVAQIARKVEELWERE